MDGDGRPVSESNGRMQGGGKAFLPIGIAFLALAVALIFSGTTSWISFFAVGITFLVLGMQKPPNRNEPPPKKIAQG